MKGFTEVTLSESGVKNTELRKGRNCETLTQAFIWRGVDLVSHKFVWGSFARVASLWRY